MTSLPPGAVALSAAGASLSLFGLATTSHESHPFASDRAGLGRISLDMEKAVLAGGRPGRVFAGFQRWSRALPVVPRYTRLARAAGGVWVFGLPDIEPPAVPGLTWVSLTERHALAREWFLVVDAERYFAALAAEGLGASDVVDERRRFQAVWSFDEAVVHELAGRLGEALGLSPAPAVQRDHGQQLARVGATVSHLLARLQAAHEALARAGRLREDLIGLLLHDLRSPLSVVLARTELMARLAAPSPEVIARSAAAIHSEARRLDEMLLNLLDVTRIEAGRLRLVKTDVDLRGLATVVADAYRPIAQAQEKAIAVGVEMPGGTLVAAERDRLTRVLGTLLGNALKYSDRGGHVEVRVRATPAGVEFAVSDDGPGVPPEARERVFERFGQAGGDTHRPGTGLGLYFCRLVVEAHGGTIGVDNRPGRGVTFRFTLPGSPAA